jgi:hypothetical protein
MEVDDQGTPVAPGVAGALANNRRDPLGRAPLSEHVPGLPHRFKPHPVMPGRIGDHSSEGSGMLAGDVDLNAEPRQSTGELGDAHRDPAIVLERARDEHDVRQTVGLDQPAFAHPRAP